MRVDWTRQQQAWQSLVTRIAPLARRGAVLPTSKLRKYFRRKGGWFVPTFDVKTLSRAQRELLRPNGPASRSLVNGPAGRAIWVEAAKTGKALATRLCQGVATRCGLLCTQASPPPANAREATIRRLVRLRTDHDLVLRIQAGSGPLRVTIPEPGVGSAEELSRLIRRAVAPLGKAARFAQQKVVRLTPGLRLSGRTTRISSRLENRLVQSLCGLAAGVPDALRSAWQGTAADRRKRGAALATWLGLNFVEKPVHRGRPPLEKVYIRRHYGTRVTTLTRRASDTAYLIRPLAVVLHHTGADSLQSALNTLRTLRLGRRRGMKPTTLGVGVPYLVARDGTVYRLFQEDRRFGRHTIGLNHSAIGIENVGSQRHPLNQRQIQTNIRLVQYLALRHPLRYLIGHRDAYQMARTPYYVEAVRRYCSNKTDPTPRVLRQIQRGVADLGLLAAPRAKPVLKDCRDLIRFLRSRRRARRRARQARP